MREKRLLIFDWDGTLFDSIERIVTSLQYAGESISGTSIPTESARNVIGKGLYDAIRMLLPDIDDAEVGRVADCYSDHYLNHNPVVEELFEGVEELIEDLRLDYQLAIATGKSRRGFNRVIERYEMMRHFSHIETGCSNPSKPDPTMLRKILETLGTGVEQTLMIGDSTLDIQMAQNMCIDAVAITTGAHDRDDFIAIGHTDCLDTIADLHEFLHH